MIDTLIARTFCKQNVLGFLLTTSCSASEYDVARDITAVVPRDRYEKSLLKSTKPCLMNRAMSREARKRTRRD